MRSFLLLAVSVAALLLSGADARAQIGGGNGGNGGNGGGIGGGGIGSQGGNIGVYYTPQQGNQIFIGFTKNPGAWNGLMINNQSPIQWGSGTSVGNIPKLYLNGQLISNHSVARAVRFGRQLQVGPLLNGGTGYQPGSGSGSSMYP